MRRGRRTIQPNQEGPIRFDRPARIARPYYASEGSFDQIDRPCPGLRFALGIVCDEKIRIDRTAFPPVALIIALELRSGFFSVEDDIDFLLLSFEGLAAEVGRSSYYPVPN